MMTTPIPVLPPPNNSCVLDCVRGLYILMIRGLGLDPDPTSAVTDSDFIAPPTRAPDPDFGFAFDDSNFSDRILQVEIVSCSLGSRADRMATSGDTVKKDVEVMSDTLAEDEDAESEDPNCSEVLRVEMFHVSSPILAAKSRFFYKLLSNGMMESEYKHVTIRVDASEEAALMELLNFMYSNTISVTTAPAILNVLLAADKFEVASCVRHCCILLRHLPMTPESALLYLGLPPCVLISDDVQSLNNLAKQFLASRYKDISKYQDEVMNLPLVGIEVILSSDDLQVISEDAVYDLVLKWTKTHYKSPEERRYILSTRLRRYIRFSFLTCQKLRKVLSCTDFDHDFATEAVLDALFLKAEDRHCEEACAIEESTYTSCHFIKRAYQYRPIKLVKFRVPRQQCVVYLDLKREDCSNLFPLGRVYSQAFHLGGQSFFLSATCSMEQESSFHCFGLFLRMMEKGSVSCAVEYEFAARSKPTEEYVSICKNNYTFTGKAIGLRNFFNIPWDLFIAEDSVYFINGILHLRADLTIRC